MSIKWFVQLTAEKWSILIRLRHRWNQELSSGFQPPSTALSPLKMDGLSRAILMIIRFFGLTRCPRWKFTSYQAMNHQEELVSPVYRPLHQQWQMPYLLLQANASDVYLLMQMSCK